MADPFALVAEPRRRRIVQLVWTREMAASDIAAAIDDVTFGAVSQHLRKLRDAGLVSLRRDGRHRYYRASREAFGPLAAALDEMWATKLSDLAALAEAEEWASQPEPSKPTTGRRRT